MYATHVEGPLRLHLADVGVHRLPARPHDLAVHGRLRVYVPLCVSGTKDVARVQLKLVGAVHKDLVLEVVELDLGQVRAGGNLNPAK